MPELSLEEKLGRARAAFDAGNYKLVRTLCRELEHSSASEISKSAIELRKRTDIDPVQLAVIGSCLVFFLWIVFKYVVH